MVFDTAKKHLEKMGLEDRIYTLEVFSAMVKLATSAMGCEPARIAKTLSFMVEGGPVLIMVTGDTEVDNHKYKEQFKTRAKMPSLNEVMGLVGHSMGGVCPLSVREGVRVYLNEPSKRFDAVYPACESANSTVRLSIPELEKASGYPEWIDVCKAWQTAVMVSQACGLICR